MFYTRKRQEETLEVWKEYCNFTRPTEHREFMFPYAEGTIHCKVPYEHLNATFSMDFPYTICHDEGLDYCTSQGLQHDFGLVNIEFPFGSGRYMVWPTCCTCIEPL